MPAHADQQRRRTADQIDIAFRKVFASHAVRGFDRRDAEILDLVDGLLADPLRPPNRDGEARQIRQILEWRIRVLLEAVHQLLVLPHIGAAAAGALVGRG
jgi:hypothetical protein